MRSPQDRLLVEGARAFFTGPAEVADVDEGGAITESGFASAARARLRDDPQGFAVVVRPWAEAVVAVADTDDNGAVDLREWERMLRAMGAAPQKAAEQAVLVGTDDDGVISVTEVPATAAAFCTRDQAGHEFDPA
ncbi:EF-hand domain-containing protein [Actinosynnema sp. NPDC053489]|uniref:EF-hand domain-containing protein n=1 Tax=Actinosynnema sp. NPDC053489 TaxID=3363916 RepID=UPI0037C7B430